MLSIQRVNSICADLVYYWLNLSWKIRVQSLSSVFRAVKASFLFEMAERAKDTIAMLSTQSVKK
jgi:hypothetical protein